MVWIGVHDLGRTGVPIVLLRYLQALPAPQRRRVQVIALRGGPLEDELARCCGGLLTLEPAGRRSLGAGVTVGLEVMGAPVLGQSLRRTWWRRRLAELPIPDVVLLHGAGAWPLLDAVPGAPPYVLHLHELATGLDRSIPSERQREALGGARRVLAVSRAVADLAIERGAHASCVHLVPGVVDDPVPAGSRPQEPGAARWVMGAGTPGWRKGTDRLAALAHPWSRERPEVRVGWVGGRPSGPDTTAVAAFDPVHWFDETPDPWEVLARAEVVVVPSREDALPLVALEAGARGLPVVSLPSGGLVDLLAEERGLVGDRHDVAWLVGAVEELLDDPPRAARMGERLRRHVERHHRARVVAPQWWSLVHDVAGEGADTLQR